MAAQHSRVTIHMVCSLDGYIAKKDNSIDWMRSTDTYDRGKTLTDKDIADFLKDIDCYIMGSKTYELAVELGWPYGEVPVIVLTGQSLKSDKPTVRFYNGDLLPLINDQLRPAYKNIWMVGGAVLSKTFIEQQLADDVIVSIMPVILGDGTPFFQQLEKEQLLHLKEVTPYSDGMVELSYELRREISD